MVPNVPRQNWIENDSKFGNLLTSPASIEIFSSLIFAFYSWYVINIYTNNVVNYSDNM